MARRSSSPRSFLALMAALAALGFGGAAQAALSGNLSVRLLAPGGIADVSADPIDLTDVRPAADGVLLAPGDGSNIGTMMLPLERIGLSGNSLLITAATGNDAGGILSTGYLGLDGSSARYEFSGLNVPGFRITGLALGSFDGFAASGFNGLLSPTDLTQVVRLTSPASLSLDLDSLRFVNRGNGTGSAFADLRIDLVTTPVPEPSTALLALAGLGLLAACRRR